MAIYNFLLAYTNEKLHIPKKILAFFSKKIWQFTSFANTKNHQASYKQVYRSAKTDKKISVTLGKEAKANICKQSHIVYSA